MDILNDTLRVNIKPLAKSTNDIIDSSTDEEVENYKEQILTQGKITKLRKDAPAEKWMTAWDDQLWTTWCMIRNFRDDNGFEILDKINSYADWCNLVWENSEH